MWSSRLTPNGTAPSAVSTCISRASSVTTPPGSLLRRRPDATTGGTGCTPRSAPEDFRKRVFSNAR